MQGVKQGVQAGVNFVLSRSNFVKEGKVNCVKQPTVKQPTEVAHNRGTSHPHRLGIHTRTRNENESERKQQNQDTTG